jgi:hypothetical protein
VAAFFAMRPIVLIANKLKFYIMRMRNLYKKSVLVLILLFAVGWANAQNIDFADSNVKAICVANWDTSGDGELSMDEAAVVTDIGTVFSNNRNIVSFDELQFFVGLTSFTYDEGQANLIGDEIGAFMGCTNLTSIMIPNTVTDIGLKAFNGCNSLVSITIPSSVTSIGEDVFISCPGLEQIIVEEGNTVYDSRDNCNAIIETNSNTLTYGCKNTIIPNSITTLGNKAFYGCSTLSSITIPNSVTTIGYEAFEACTGLTSILIPNSVSTIKLYAFYRCSSLISITLSSSANIGMYAFSGCSNLSSITVRALTPPGLGSGVFQNVNKTIPVYIPAGTIDAYSSIGGWNEFSNFIEMGVFFADANVESICLANFDTDENGEISLIEATAVSDLGSLFSGNQLITSFDELHYFTGLSAIGDNAFAGCTSLTSVTFPDAITSIGTNAFAGCTSLTSIKIPGSVTSIGESAFSFCTGLTSFTVDAITPPALGNLAFQEVNKSIPVHVPGGTTSVYMAADGWNEFFNYIETIFFADTNVKAICVANWDTDGDGEISYAEAAAVTYLGSFYNNNSITSFDELQYFTGLTYINSSTFSFCSNLSSVVLPNNLNSIGDWAFWQTGVTTITIPNSVTGIGEGAFGNLEQITLEEGNPVFDARDNCNAIIRTATNTLVLGCNNSIIPNSVTAIDRRAFVGCSGLTSITIPSLVTNIGEGAFSSCGGLVSITVRATTPPTLGSYAFSDVNKSIPVYIPGGTIDAYSSAEGWNEFTNFIEFTITFADANVKALCVNSFDTDEDGEISIDEAAVVTNLGNTFSSNQLITSFDELHYFTGLSAIGDNAFAGCTSLTSVTFPDAITSFGTNAFAGCTSLTSIKIPGSVTSIGEGAFSFCTGLTSLTVNATTPPILGNLTFQEVDKSIPVYVPNGTTSVYLAADGWNEFFNYNETSISFADANVKAICVANWDTDGDGEISYDEAAAVTNLGSFFNNNSITSFDELQYFTGLTSINSNAFSFCSNLSSIVLPNNLNSIGDWAFWGTGLTTITIPNSVTGIGEGVFGNLEQITLEEGNPVFDARDNCNAIIRTETNSLVVGCNNSIIPNSVTAIERRAFGGCSGLTSIIIPNSVTSIGYNAFTETGLTSIIIPNSVTSIGVYAFAGCTNLNSVILSNALTSIEDCTFRGCGGLTTITIPNSVTTIGESAFEECSSLTSLTIPTSVTSIGNSAFGYCTNLTSITVQALTPPNLGSNVFQDVDTTIPVYIPGGTLDAYSSANGWNEFTNFIEITITFADANVKALCVNSFDTDEDGEISIDEAAAVSDLGSIFSGNQLITSFDELKYFTGLSAIGDYAFSGCSGLTLITLPNSITSIGQNAFAGCTGLTSIKIPNIVTTIGEEGFSGCTGLTTLYVNATTPPVLGTSVFDGVNQNIPVYVPGGTASTYLATDGWDYFFNYNETSISFADANVEAICLDFWDLDEDGQLTFEEASAVTYLGNVFQGNEEITSFNELQYFRGLTSLVGTFFGCTNLTSVVIPNTVTTIGDGAFEECTSLESITIPNSVTSIGNFAFWGCYSLTFISIPNSVTTIRDGAFAYCSSITSIIIPNTVTSLDLAPFYGCSGLEQITVEEGNPVYDSRDNCNAIIKTNTNTIVQGCQNTIIPNTVISIGMGAFAEIESLTSMDIPNSVTTIGESAFSGCNNLTSISFPNSLTTIGNWAFDSCESITSLIIPGSVAYIGDDAFSGCTNLTSITVQALTPPTLGSDVFQNVPTDIPVYIPGGTLDAYSSAEGWSTFTTFIESNTIVFADENVEAICVDNWDGDNDEHLSYAEAAAVTDLGAVFQYNEDITSFDELQYFTGLTAIGDYAFTECSSLTSISIPSSVTAIGGSAFEFTGLTTVNIPNSVSSIGMNAFADCQDLVSISLPNALTTIEENVFGGCSSLTSINIPGSVTAIGNDAFSWCEGLASLTVNATTPPVLGTSVFLEVNNSIPVYVPGGTISAYMEADGWDYFFNYIETSISFTDDIVEAICLDYWDFDGDGQLTFEEAAEVRFLEGAFQGNEEITSFDELQYFSGLDFINNDEFQGCSSLASITIPNSLEEIGSNAFTGCASLTSISIPSSVAYIGEGLFIACNALEVITVEEGNPVYDSRDNCNAIIETSTNTLISGCQNTIIPNNVTSIGWQAFAGIESLTAMAIPNLVTSIGVYAFGGCSGLTSVIIPNLVTTIEESAFSGCTGLTSMKVLSTTPPTLGFEVFNEVDKSIPVYVPVGTINDYLNAEGWSEFTNYIEIQTIDFLDANVEAICLNLWDSDHDGFLSFVEAEAVTDLGTAFQNNTEITSFNELQYFTGLASISVHAFEGCTALAAVTLPEMVAIIGEEAFSGCTALLEITIPGTVTNIGDEAFNDCSGLTSMDVEATVPPVLGTSAFQNVDKNIPVHVPDGTTSAYSVAPGWEEFFNYVETNIIFADTIVEAICLANWDTDGNGKLSYEEAAAVTDLGGAFHRNAEITSFDELQFFTGLRSLVYHGGNWDGSFFGCTNLSSIVIPNSLTIIGTSAFDGCIGLTSITIPSTVTSIEEYAFWGTGITSINIPSSVRNIGEGAFGETGITSITIPSTTISIDGKLFMACADLEQVIVEESNPVYDSRENCNAIIETSINTLISGCKTSIIPNTVTSIGERAFNDVYLTSITIPRSVINIQDYAFGNNNSLSSVTVLSLTPPTVGGEYVFEEIDTSIPIHVPMGTISAYTDAYGWSGFTNYIDDLIVFADANVEDISLNLWDSNHDGALSLEEAEAVTDLGTAFQNHTEITSFNELQYFTGLASINAHAFEGCTALSEITIPETVTSIGEEAFSGCTGLIEMHLQAEAPATLGNNAFLNVQNTIPVWIPCETLDAYTAALGWDYFTNYIDFCLSNIDFADVNVKALCVANWDNDGNGEISYAEAAAVTELGNVFQRRTNITSFNELQYFTGLNSIEATAFTQCSDLASITIPNSVTSIGNYAFAECSNLVSITIPNSVTNIGNAPFFACGGLEQITVEEGNPVYDSRDNCNAIIETATNVLIAGCQNTIIPNTVTYIYAEAFSGIESLTSIVIPSSVQSIGDWAFGDCSGLTSMIIFNPNAQLGYGVFNGITIPETTFVAASASPAEGGGLLGVYVGNENVVDDYQSFIGTYEVQNSIIEYVPQGNGQISSTVQTILAAHHNEGWQFAGWYLNGELVSYDPVLSFRAFGSFAFEARFEPCGYMPDPELLSGRFSISGCSTVGFTKSNAIIKGDMENAFSSGNTSLALLSVITENGMPGFEYEFGVNQWDHMTYDSTAFASNYSLYAELISTTGVDLIPQFYFKGNEGCWHILTGSEWNYLLNQRNTESGVRFAFAKVNDVNGLVILPDDWIADTYTFNNFNEIADYQNNIITFGSWLATLEPAGAVFLPVNGIMNAMNGVSYIHGNGEMGVYPGLFISPDGSLPSMEMELPMTGDIVNVLTSIYCTSLRLAQITPQPSTVTVAVAVAAEQSEWGVVSGGGEVDCGQTCTVTATANPGYVFQFWKENGQIVSTEMIYSFKAKGNRDLVAQFANVDEVCNVVFDLMGQAIGWGGNALHVEYEGVSFELTMPTPEELSFLELESMMGSSETITQTYPVFIDRGATVNLSWHSALGEMPGSGASFSIHYEDGATIHEGDEANLPFQFECSCEDVSCDILAFSVPSSDYGDVYGGGIYTYGETCTLIAYANYGYHFTGWKENGIMVCESPAYQFTVTSSRTLEATFAMNCYYTFSLATEPEEGGVLYAIDAIGDAPYPIETPYSVYEPVEEADLSISAKAKKGWRFAYWTANDEIVSYDNFYHFHLSRDTDLVAHFVECELETEPDENLLSGRFSVSGCTTVGFAKGNMIAQFQIDTIFTYNLIGTSWQFAETQYYRQEYDSLAILENGIRDQLLSSGMDLVSGLHQAMGLVDIGCWHELSGSEWDYLLNQRDVEVRYAFAEVNGVSGLLVLPDNWQSSTYPLNAPNTTADYATNTISLSVWQNIVEPAGALFLPANGTITNTGTASNPSYMYALNGNDGEQYRPIGVYGDLMFSSLTTEDPMGGGVMTGVIGMDYMMALVDMHSCKRLAQIVQMETSTVDAIASQAERGLVSGGGQFACNAECTLTATANEGYVFQYWMEGSSVVSVENPYVFTVEGDRNLTAVFVDADEVCNVQFDLDCGSDSYGMFGMGGEALQLSFNDGTPDIQLTMPAPKIDWYAMQLAELIGESIDPSTYGFPTSYSYSIPINKGTDVDMSLVPLQPSIFGQMSSGPVSNTFSASYVFGDPIVENAGSGDAPSFQCNCEGFVVNLNLSVDPEEGGEIQAEGFPNYGETVTVTAVANEGYHFVDWTLNGAVVSTEPTYSLVATEDGDLVAHFEINYYEVIAIADPEEGGTVTSGAELVFCLYDSNGDGWNGNQLLVYLNGYPTEPLPLTLNSGSSTTITQPFPSGTTTLKWQTGSYPEQCSFEVYYADGTLIYRCSSPRTSLPYTFECNGSIFSHGSTCYLRAEAHEGYTFANWTENGEVVSTEPWYTFEVTSDRELVANFSPPITITATANPSEGGTVTGTGTFNYGTYCTLTATPNEGFAFSAWTENGETVSTYAVYGFDVTQERHLVAEFVPLYTITASANPSEGGTVSGAGNYPQGCTCTLTATPNDIYIFDNWTLNGTVVSVEPTYTFTVTGAGDYVANFSLKTYEITATVTPTGAGTVNGTGTYTHGTQCTLTAIANEGYAFNNWMENGEVVSNDATYAFTVTGERNLVAAFLPTYVITAEANDPAYGSVTGAGTYMEGQTCTLTASPNEGYVFSVWTEDGETVSTDATYSFTVISARSLVAVFLPTYIINAEANNAEYGSVTGGGTYVVNVTCTLNATPAEGYEFVNWTENGEVVHSESEYAFTVTGNRNLVANFVLKNYDILVTADPEEGGTATGAGNYNHFETCTLTATANVGYTFINWTQDGVVVSTEPTYSFTVTGAGAYVANFLLNSYAITASANPSEGGTVTGAGTYNHFETCTLTATANVDYNFDNWTLDGAVVSTDPTYTFIVTGAGDYVANFSLKTYEITATVTPTEAGTVTGAGIYAHGTQCTLTAIANEGYAFNNWMENGVVVSTDATYAFTVTGERNLVAAFLPTYVITAEANDPAYGSVTGAGTFVEGETCTLTASPNEGYVFSAWTEDGETVSTDAIYSFTVTEARSFVAVFLPTYVITAEANNAEYGSVTGGGTYVVNVTCTLNATPAEGYEFVNWTENGEVVHSEAEYAFAVTSNRSLVANFVLKNYDILATANPNEGGTVNGAGNYNHFETCTLVATANWGYTFINWTLDGNVVSTEPSYTFTVTSAGDYTANFQLNNYAINASANPSEGGSVSGAGNYDHGTECTLTATANVGYTFVNWTLDGDEVGTDPTYTFTVYEEATYVAKFSLNLYEITAIANPVEGGTITGAGNYYHGDECILTAIPIENYTFLYWTENGNYLSSDAIYSFVATSDRSLVAIFAGNEQTMSLSPGWTWLSSYIEMEGNDGLGMLENGLNPNGVMIKSQRDGFVSYAGGMWIGTLDGISNEKMYLVNTNEASDVTFTGPVANMMNHPITLNHNWTWIGYPSPFALDINDALANLNASEGDVVKTQSNFATYSTNDGWSGSLNQLTPGMGLMYQSHNSQPVTFNYGVGMSRALKANLTAENNHWVPDIHAYPNNMSIMAVVELNGEELQDERYELAVFNGSECRGSARLVYVPSLRRYVAFLTVTGEDDVELYLALYDTRKGKAYYNTTDCPNFEANAVLGSLSMPFVARFGGATELDELDVPNIELYPNPVVAGHLFQMEMPAECQGARVSIVNALGAVISTTDVYDEPAIMRAPAVPGVYTVRIVTDKQGTFTRKLIVNK